MKVSVFSMPRRHITSRRAQTSGAFILMVTAMAMAACGTEDDQIDNDGQYAVDASEESLQVRVELCPDVGLKQYQACTMFNGRKAGQQRRVCEKGSEERAPDAPGIASDPAQLPPRPVFVWSAWSACSSYCVSGDVVWSNCKTKHGKPGVLARACSKAGKWVVTSECSPSSLMISN